MSKEVILVGYGGHGFVAADILQATQITLSGYCDNEKKPYNPFAIKYRGSEATFFSIPENIAGFDAFVAVGNGALRKKIYTFLIGQTVNIISAVHPLSVIGQHVVLGNGVFVAASATINTCCNIGHGVICNTSSTIDHECNIGEFSHICPGAVLCGNVTVGKNCFIGANSTIIPGKKIYDNIVVGAGSVVISDLTEPGLYVGAPARLIKLM